MDFVQKLKRYLAQIPASALKFWLILFFLNSLFFLPEVLLHPGNNRLIPLPPLHDPRGWYDFVLFFFRRENMDIFRLQADFLLLVTLLWLAVSSSFSDPIKRTARRLSTLSYLALLLFTTYESSMFFIFGQYPVFYNDLKLALGAFYLVVDLGFSRLAGIIILVLLAGGLIFFILPRLFHFLGERMSRHRPTPRLLIPIILFWLGISGLTYWFGYFNPISTVRWVVPKIVRNITESARVYSFIHQAEDLPADTTYDGYARIRLSHPPTVYLLMIESYGKILADHPLLREGYVELMRSTDDSLRTDGWHSASNYSTAPISGGLSWLSIATVLNGMKIKDQAIYDYLLDTHPRMPNLLRFLNANGYHTFNLQPMNRERPGYSFDDYEALYPYRTPIYTGNLDYEGEAFGFGFLPDQYSLFYAHRKFLASAPNPYFLFFITTSSHYPWIETPPFVKNLDRLEEIPSPTVDNSDLDQKMNKTLQMRFAGPEHYPRYLESIGYQFRVIREYIRKMAPANSLFILLGDHQPPMITRGHSSFDTPLHIVSRDSALVADLQRFGFQPGLLCSNAPRNRLHHEGIYSLLVRVLAENYSDLPAERLPAYKPEGVRLSIIREKD